MEHAIGFGIAGNFAGHLEQAGEVRDFTQVKAPACAPKGIFPFFVPGGDGVLGTYPVSATTLRYPDAAFLGVEGAQLQIEPELALVCEVEYAHGMVERVVPRLAGAFNDCSIRRAGATKISQKKNWGPASKGLSRELFALDGFAAGGLLDHLHLASFLERDGVLHAYGEAAPISGDGGYSYFHQQLLDWVVFTLNHQVDHGPLEDLRGHLARAQHPAHLLLAVGATRYTPFGASHFLQPGDVSWVVLHDVRHVPVAAVAGLLRSGAWAAMGAAEGLCVLRQAVLPAAD